MDSNTESQLLFCMYRAALSAATTRDERCSLRRAVAVSRGQLARSVELSAQQRDQSRWGMHNHVVKSTGDIHSFMMNEMELMVDAEGMHPVGLRQSITPIMVAMCFMW